MGLCSCVVDKGKKKLREFYAGKSWHGYLHKLKQVHTVQWKQ